MLRGSLGDHPSCNAAPHPSKWHAHALTPARRNAVPRLGWDYIGVPVRWAPQNHAQLPAGFQQKVTAVALAWQLTLVPFNRKPPPGSGAAGGRGDPRPDGAPVTLDAGQALLSSLNQLGSTADPGAPRGYPRPVYFAPTMPAAQD